MTSTSQKSIVKPKLEILWALLLSVFFPGAGQIYNGQLRKGIAAVLILFSLYLIFFKLALLGFPYLVGTMTALVLFWTFLTVDAIRKAAANGKAGFKLATAPHIYFIFFLFYFSTKAIVSSQNRIEFYNIPANAMIPTLMPHDRIVADLGAYENEEALPKRGDLIVFEYPKDPQIIYVKRVIGLPGDEVEIKNKTVFLNGQKLAQKPLSASEVNKYSSKVDQNEIQDGARLHFLNENLEASSYVIAKDASGAGIADFSKIVVPDDQFFVLGDNRDFSNDSRFWGFVPKKNILGKIRYLYYSKYARLGSLPRLN